MGGAKAEDKADLGALPFAGGSSGRAAVPFAGAPCSRAATPTTACPSAPASVMALVLVKGFGGSTGLSSLLPKSLVSQAMRYVAVLVCKLDPSASDANLASAKKLKPLPLSVVLVIC